MEIRLFEIQLSPDSQHGEADFTHYGYKRSPGMHVSDVIRDLANRVIRPGERRRYSELAPAEQTQMLQYTENGFTWEDALAAAWGRRRVPRDASYQVELKRDGLWLTLDAIVREPGGQCFVEEYKMTWKSAAKLDSAENFERNFWEWVRQSQSYCAAVETNRVDFVVMWTNGDYKPPKPKAIGYSVIYTAQELAENWQMILRHRDRMLAEGWRPDNTNGGNAPQLEDM